MTQQDVEGARVLLINQFFQPEPNMLRGAQFAQDLQERGVSVEVLTGFPNYPVGRLYEGYKMRWYQNDEVEPGLVVHRVPHFVSHDESGLRRAASYLSLMMSSLVFLLVRGRRYDVVWVQQGPATLGVGAVLSRFMRRGQRFVLDAQDLWPDSVTSTGMLPRWVPAGIVEGFSRFVASSADHVITLSPGAAERLRELGVDEKDTTIVYNWCSEPKPDSESMAHAAAVLESSGHRFHVVYVGGFGVLQDLRTVVEAAGIVADATPDVGFVLAGDGVEFDEISDLVARSGRTNVLLTGRVSAATGAALVAAADVALLHLRETPLSSTAVPSKIASYLYEGTPVIVAAEGAVAEVADRAQAGFSVASGSPDALAEAIISIVELDPAVRRAHGERGRAFYDENMSRKRGVDEVCGVISRLR